MADGFDSLRPERFNFSDQSDPLTVKKASTAPGVLNNLAVNPDGKNHQHHQEQEKKRPELKDYFHVMQKATEATNAKLIEKKSPLRFHIYRQGDEVFIDLIILDETGHIKQETRKNITHEDFARWIEDVSAGEGVMFDGMG